MHSHISADFWLLDRLSGPNEREPLQLDCPAAPCAYAVFTSEEKALAYQKARLNPEWELAAVTRADLADSLADARECGVEFVVLDPWPGDGRILTIFQALIELS